MSSRIQCPSEAWDDYCRWLDASEPPDVCPWCNKPSYIETDEGEDGYWLFPEAPGFCSEECCTAYYQAEHEHDRAMWQEMQAADQLAAEYWEQQNQAQFPTDHRLYDDTHYRYGRR